MKKSIKNKKVRTEEKRKKRRKNEKVHYLLKTLFKISLQLILLTKIINSKNSRSSFAIKILKHLSHENFFSF